MKLATLTKSHFLLILLISCQNIKRATIVMTPCQKDMSISGAHYNVRINSNKYILEKKIKKVDINEYGVIDTIFCAPTKYKDDIYTDFKPGQRLYLKACGEDPEFYSKSGLGGKILIQNQSDQAYRIHCRNNDIFEFLPPGTSYELDVKVNPVDLAFTTKEELEKRGQGMDYRGRIRYSKMIRFICHSGLKFNITCENDEQFLVSVETN